MVGLLLGTCIAASAGAQTMDSLAVARRIVAAASLAAKEYAVGVAPGGGRVTNPEEVSEAKQFLDQARLDVGSLPRAVRATADSDFVALRAMLARAAPPAAVAARAALRVQHSATVVGGALETFPSRPPSLGRGAAVYQEQCARCHGPTGRGDGPKAKQLQGPPPASLADRDAMSTVSPLDVYRKITLGVAGPASPPFRDAPPPAGTPGPAAGPVEPRLLVAPAPRRLGGDAYRTLEQVETDVRVKSPALASDLEQAFTLLRARAAAGAGPDELAPIHARLLADLERAERLVADRSSSAGLFVQSFVLLLREGFEAILIVAALMAFLSKAGALERRRHVARGAWAAVAASAATAVVIELLFEITPGQREALEGGTMLLATAVLFYVSYWLLSKIEVAKWNAFVKGRMEDALSTGSGFALSSVAFLAVYREGFETILFYKALLSSAGVDRPGGGGGGVVGGCA